MNFNLIKYFFILNCYNYNNKQKILIFFNKNTFSKKEIKKKNLKKKFSYLFKDIVINVTSIIIIIVFYKKIKIFFIENNFEKKIHTKKIVLKNKNLFKLLDKNVNSSIFKILKEKIQFFFKKKFFFNFINLKVKKKEENNNLHKIIFETENLCYNLKKNINFLYKYKYIFIKNKFYLNPMEINEIFYLKNEDNTIRDLDKCKNFLKEILLLKFYENKFESLNDEEESLDYEEVENLSNDDKNSEISNDEEEDDLFPNQESNFETHNNEQNNYNKYLTKFKEQFFILKDKFLLFQNQNQNQNDNEKLKFFSFIKEHKLDYNFNQNNQNNQNNKICSELMILNNFINSFIPIKSLEEDKILEESENIFIFLFYKYFETKEEFYNPNFFLYLLFDAHFNLKEKSLFCASLLKKYTNIYDVFFKNQEIFFLENDCSKYLYFKNFLYKKYNLTKDLFNKILKLLEENFLKEKDLDFQKQKKDIFIEDFETFKFLEEI